MDKLKICIACMEVTRIHCCNLPIVLGDMRFLKYHTRKSCRVRCIRSSTASTKPNLFERHGFVRMLEHPTSQSSAVAFSQGLEKNCFSDGIIQAVVYPDIKHPFSFPLDIWSRTSTYTKDSGTEESFSSDSIVNATSECWQVRTVAAQMRTNLNLKNQILDAVRKIKNRPHGGSLLFVSGGHPLKNHWVFNCLSKNCFDLLKLGHHLREDGLISSGIQIWAVENPLHNSVDRLEKKILAGAEAFIVQPPLLPDVFTKWWNEANLRGLLDVTKVIVGIPVITSSRNFKFWLHLTLAKGKEAQVILQDFQNAEEFASSEERKLAFFRNWNLKVFELVKSLPKVAGVHLMPITPAGWHEVAVLLSEGRFL